MITNHAIKRGASLYSFQEHYYFQKYTLEDCIAALADMGGEGVEIIPDQMIREFPKVSDAFVDQWHGWMHRYAMRPVAIDDFVEHYLYKNRPTTLEEKVARFNVAAKLANRLGCRIIREQFAIGDAPLMTVELMEQCLPIAEEYDVIIALEIHAPNYIGNPQIDSFIEFMDKKNSAHLGIIPDTSIFVHNISPVHHAFYRRQGVRDEVISIVDKSYRERYNLPETLNELGKTKLTDIENEYVTFMHQFNKNTDPNTLRQIAPYLVHFHMKFVDMTEDYQDVSVDNLAIINVLKDVGFKGCLASEYEGNRYKHDIAIDDCIEQVRRHQKMLEMLLGY